jgi:hypothetical protein
MYAARPEIERRAEKPLGSKFDQYFTQQLLPDYIEEAGVDWDVVYDDRGHFSEPHGGLTIGLGTLSVLPCQESKCLIWPYCLALEPENPAALGVAYLVI